MRLEVSQVAGVIVADRQRGASGRDPLFVVPTLHIIILFWGDPSESKLSELRAQLSSSLAAERQLRSSLRTTQEELHQAREVADAEWWGNPSERDDENSDFDKNPNRLSSSWQRQPRDHTALQGAPRGPADSQRDEELCNCGRLLRPGDMHCFLLPWNCTQCASYAH